ncbi:MAG: 2-dehydro-3-deoxy-6-phosphogalactonate aldolase [Caulobacteraceae bacterium]
MTLDDVLAGLPLIAVLRGIEPAEAVSVGEALYTEGFTALEVTLNSPRPLDSIAALRAHFEGRMLVGAGTVLSAGEVREAAAAGAEFIVSPDANPEVIRAAKAAGLGSLPGVFTPTEAFAALAAGARALKLFPAEASTPAALTALLAVLPARTKVLPVGGIEPRTMSPWRAAGAAGFGIGGALYKPGRAPDEVRVRARAFAQAWNGE